jgi:hypothetical protein
MNFYPDSFSAAPLREFNPCHNPKGSATGGQFCSKEQATGGYPEQGDDAGWARYWAKNNAWERKMTHAVALGLIEPEDAKLLGWRPDGHAAEHGYEPLPPVLYHVSTGFNEILRHGIKTRAEIGGVHRGLGGGNDQTISFTDDLKTARAIRSAILEARRVARGELTPAMMVRMSKAQPARLVAGTPRAAYMQSQGPVSAHEMLMTLYAGKQWKTGDRVPENLRLLLKGYTIDRVEGLAGAVKDLPTGVLPYRPWKGRDEKFTTNVIRKMTPDERREASFEMYKRFAVAREYAGGRMDPMFFMTDAKALAAVKVKDIKILKFRPRPKAKGYRVSALGEWRVDTGRTVKYDGIVEAAR